MVLARGVWRTSLVSGNECEVRNFGSFFLSDRCPLSGPHGSFLGAQDPFATQETLMAQASHPKQGMLNLKIRAGTRRVRMGMQLPGYRYTMESPLQGEPTEKWVVGCTLLTWRVRVRGRRCRSSWPISGRRGWWRSSGTIPRRSSSALLGWKRRRSSHCTQACLGLTSWCTVSVQRWKHTDAYPRPFRRDAVIVP